MRDLPLLLNLHNFRRRGDKILAETLQELLGVEHLGSLLRKAAKRKGLTNFKKPIRLSQDTWGVQHWLRLDDVEKYHKWLAEHRPKILEGYEALDANDMLRSMHPIQWDGYPIGRVEHVGTGGAVLVKIGVP